MQKEVRELFSITERSRESTMMVRNKGCSLIMTYLCMFNETSAKVATELTASGYT